MSTIEITLISLLKQWCGKNEIPDDHGLKHYIDVYECAKPATVALTPDQRLAVLLACLLHDVDDRKLKRFTFVGSVRLPLPTEEAATPLTTAYPVAASFLLDIEVSTVIRTLTLEMIDLVSTSKNGDRAPLESDKLWMLIPRDCDRLQALGKIGAQRCMEYTVRTGMPLVTPTTSLPCNEAELKEVMKTRTLEAYVASGGVSASMLDHYMDKLFNLKPGSGNVVLEAAFAAEIAIMKEIFFAYVRVFGICKITTNIYGKALP